MSSLLELRNYSFSEQYFFYIASICVVQFFSII
jgi:hypothetical protein